MQEDPPKKSKIDHKDDGIPEVHMDYKELHKVKRPFLIVRERATGSTFGMRSFQKGPGDAWGLAKVRLTVRSDGEPAIKVLRTAIKQARKGGTTFGTPPPREPQSNGVAERAVKEFMGQMRKLKLGLESRLRTTIPNDHVMVDWIALHAGFLINKYLKGSQDGFTAHYRLHGKEYGGDLAEIGECVWAKPKRTGRKALKQQEDPLGARGVQGVWLGVHEETGYTGCIDEAPCPSDPCKNHCKETNR